MNLKGFLLFTFSLSLLLLSPSLKSPLLSLLSSSLLFYLFLSHIHFSWRIHSTRRSLSVKRVLSQEKAPVGGMVHASLSFKCSSKDPLSIKENIPSFFKVKGDTSVQAMERAELSYSFSSPERGMFTIGPTSLSIQDPFFSHQEFLSNPSSILFYPNLSEIRKYDVQLRRSGRRLKGVRRSVAHGAGTEFLSLRRYLPGDEVRQIDWKATARMGRLIVRTFEEERKQRVMILLDSGRRMNSGSVRTMLDCAIDASVLLSHIILRRGDLLGFAIFSDRLDFLMKPGNNRSRFYMVLEALGKVSPSRETDHLSSFKQLTPFLTKRSLIILISPLQGDPRRVVDAIKVLKAHKHAIVIIAPFEPWFEMIKSDEELVRIIAECAEEKYRRDLGHISSQLKKLGVTLIPAGPHDIMSKSISRYIKAINEGLATV